MALYNQVSRVELYNQVFLVLYCIVLSPLHCTVMYNQVIQAVYNQASLALLNQVFLIVQSGFPNIVQIMSPCIANAGLPGTSKTIGLLSLLPQHLAGQINCIHSSLLGYFHAVRRPRLMSSSP